MNLSKEYWYIVETVDVHVAYTGSTFREQCIDVYSKGYAKRNAHLPSQIQVILQDVDNQMVVFYMPEDQAEAFIVPIKPAPPNATPDLYWSRYWAIFQQQTLSKSKK